MIETVRSTDEQVKKDLDKRNDRLEDFEEYLMQMDAMKK